MKAILIIKPGKKLGDIGSTIQKYVEAKGFSVVRDFCGHGIGTVFTNLQIYYIMEIKIRAWNYLRE